MQSWLICLYFILILSTVEARSRAHSKRRLTTSTPSTIPNPSVDNNDFPPGEVWPGVHKEEASTKSNNPPLFNLNTNTQANDEQVEQFTRLLFERLNLKEPPNVTVNVSEGTGFPSSIVKQLEQQAKEQQYLHQKEEDFYYRQQKIQDEITPTAERAILPGDHIQHHTCQRQLQAKLNLPDDYLDQIDCFRFTKSPKETNSLPNNQMINELRIYLRKNYFHFTVEHQMNQLAPDMFKVYQIFRPTANDTNLAPPYGLIDTARILLSQVKELNENWLELIVDGNQRDFDLQQVYRQLIMPWYGVAIDRDLYPVDPSLPPTSTYRHLHHHRPHHARKHHPVVSSYESDMDAASEKQLPYMLVEYGEKISSPSSSSGNRGTRSATARPARGCNPNSPCCRRSLTIDLDQGSNALNFVIYPRQLDIGECVGLCGLSGSSLKYTEVKNAQQKNEHNSAYNLLLLQNGLHFNRSTTTTQVNRPDQHSPQCCSYSRTGGLELMYTTTNGGPIIRKFIPNMVVEECKCGLPATIQQV